MQNQNVHSWPWGQNTGGQPFLSNQPVLPTTFAPTGVEQNPLLTGYQQMYGSSPAQPPADYSQWTSAQFQQWQQWQQWQEKYQEWQAQYGKKYAESLAAMGQNPGVLVPGFSSTVPPPVGVPKPVEPVAGGSNPPLPSNAQPVPPPPPEEEKPPLLGHLTKSGSDVSKSESKDNPDELSEAEKIFNVQFKQWESEFEEWKKQNQDHPDKAQYREYEKKWEAWREQLLQRLEQMKKKRLEKANEAKTGKDDIKGKPGPGQGKSTDTDYGYRTQPPPTPQSSFTSEPPKFDKPPPMTQPPPNFTHREKDIELNRGAPFSSNLNFHQNRGSFGNFDSSQERTNTMFGNLEGDGRFRNPGQHDGPRFGNFDNFPSRRFEERNFGPPSRFPGDNYREFNRGFDSDKGPFGNDNRQGPARHKVPSLFDIQVEKPPGLMGLSNDPKPKVWEKNDFDKKQPESKPWVNNPWSKNLPSPWMQQPWGMDKKPPEAKPWERDGLQTERPWLEDNPVKRPIDRVELSGYVGNILAKLGNVVPQTLGNKIEEPPDKTSDDPENKTWEEGATGEMGKQRERDVKVEGQNPEDRRFGDSSPNLNLDVDDRIRDRFRRVPFSRDERGFTRPGDRRNFGNDDRLFERGPFARRREDRGLGGRFPREDVDERFGTSRNGRRGFDRFDRDERHGSGGGVFFERFGREQIGEPVWKPQVFDYSQGRPMRVSDSDEGFKISTVVDYSHGENKQTFDYSHGESSKNKLELKSFDYGHRADSPTIIDYGHGMDATRGDKGKNNEEKCEDGLKGNSETQPSMKRSRSPRGSIIPRSRSPHSKFKRNSVSPPFKNLASRNRDRAGRQTMRPDKISEDKHSPIDGDVSKHSFTVTTVLVEDLICRPGRESRPSKLVFIMRGLPGSGKTYVTKLIKDKEVELGGDPPRILSLDDYFMTEVEKETIDSETGRKVRTKTLEYEYEAAVEPHYRGSLVKAFKKTVSDGFFSFIIVDSVNEKTKDYEEMWSFAKQKGFQVRIRGYQNKFKPLDLLERNDVAVYIAEMDSDVTVCTARNIHKRTEKEISDLAKLWEETPVHYLRLDVRSLLQSDAITEVEMEVVSDTELEKTIGKEEEKEEGEPKEEEEEEKEEEKKEDDDEAGDSFDGVTRKDEPGVSAFAKSRWDQFENSEQNLDRLDGLKRRREGFHATMEDYLQLPDDFDLDVQDSTPGKKRVRWADLEERKQQEKMRAIGFVVGQTDWSRMTDPTFGESALTRTKYI